MSSMCSDVNSCPPELWTCLKKYKLENALPVSLKSFDMQIDQGYIYIISNGTSLLPR